MNPETFFGTSERWKEKHEPRTNSKTKGKKQWSKPTSRDLTQIPGGRTKGRSPTKPPKSKKKTTRKKKDDPLGNL